MRVTLVVLGMMTVLCLAIHSPPVGAQSSGDVDCGAFANQKAAQKFFIAQGGPTSDPDNLDEDGDGRACQSLPCPCAGQGGGGRGGSAKPVGKRHCLRPARAIFVTFHRRRYPHIIAHIKASWSLGYPRVLRINRRGASARRDALLAGIPTRPGFDRDEAPAAVLRSQVQADVRYVRSRENRSAGSSLGDQIRGYCNGVKVRYRFPR